jgi:hypothetical protein
MWDWVDASKGDEGMWDQLWVEHCLENDMADYLGQFSGEDTYCIDCGDPTDDEYKLCMECRVAQGDAWKGEVIGWNDGSVF